MDLTNQYILNKDNFNGPTALFPATGTGVLRSMLGNYDSIADIIPVDLTVNLLIAAGWFTATKSSIVRADNSSNSNSTKYPILVYNCTSGQINRFTWGMLEEIGNECVTKNPFENVVLLPNPRFTTSKYELIMNTVETILY